MENFAILLARYAASHPAAQLCDLYKLAFQAAQGANHLLNDLSAARESFFAQWNACRPKPGPVFMQLSGQFARMYLPQAKAAGLPAGLCFAVFVASAEPCFDETALAKNAKAVQDYCDGGWFSAADKAQAVSYWEDWLRTGQKPFSHSEAYHLAYAPAYRVVKTECAQAMQVLWRLWQLKEKAYPAVAVLDGRCGSGKTTLANLCSKVLEIPVVRMDDFFLPLSLRTNERYAQPGGNLHWERFQAQVLPALGTGRGFSYQVFSCKEGAIVGERNISPSNLVLVEGSYALHPAFGHFYQQAFFCDVSAQEQSRRLLARSGQEAYLQFASRWIPMEERYFAACQVEKRCQMTVFFGEEPIENIRFG